MDRTLTFLRVDQRESTLQCLYDQVKNSGKYCDLPMRTRDGTIVAAHSCVMSRVPYFYSRDRFSGGIAAEPVDLSNITSESLGCIVKYVYVGEFTLHMNDLPELFEAADFLGMRETLLSDVLDKLLQEPPSLEMLCTLHTLCQLYALDHPGLDNLKLHFDGRLSEILDSGLLDSASPDHMLKFIKDAALSSASFEQFAKFLVRWTLFDEESREEFFPGIFDEIPLQDFGFKDITDLLGLLEASFPARFPDVKEKVRKAIETRDWKRAETVHAIVVAGGVEAHELYTDYCIATSNVWVYMSDKDHWISLPRMPCPMGYPVMATDGLGNILVCDKNARLGDGGSVIACRFSLQDGVWTKEEYHFAGCFTPESVKNLVAADGKFYLFLFGHIDRKTDRDIGTVAMVEVKQPPGHPLQIQEHVLYKAKVIPCPVKEDVVVEINYRGLTQMYYVSPNSRCVTLLSERLFGGFLNYCGDTLLHYKLGISVRQFHVGKEGAKCIEEIALPKPPGYGSSSEAGYGFADENLVLCGGRERSWCRTIRRAVYLFDVEKRAWLRLSDLPQSLHDSAVLHVRLPRKYGQCRKGCAHCQLPLMDQDHIWEPLDSQWSAFFNDGHP